jgi:cation transporter-like permease
METRRAISNLMGNLLQIVLISVMLAACVGIGSWLTQSALKVPVDFNLVGMLALIFGVISIFVGVVFSFFSKKPA